MIDHLHCSLEEAFDFVNYCLKNTVCPDCCGLSATFVIELEHFQMKIWTELADFLQIRKSNKWYIHLGQKIFRALELKVNQSHLKNNDFMKVFKKLLGRSVVLGSVLFTVTSTMYYIISVVSLYVFARQNYHGRG